MDESEDNNFSYRLTASMSEFSGLRFEVTEKYKCRQHPFSIEMRLSYPTDFLILEALADGKRDTGANLAKRIDRDRRYINNELPKLADQGLIKKIGPHEHSGLYQITSLGVAAIQKQSLYNEDEDEFEAEIYELEDRIEIERPSVTIYS